MSTSPLTVSISVRRSSPNRFFISSSSFLTISSTRASSARMSSQSAIFACRAPSSSSIFTISRPARRPSCSLHDSVCLRVIKTELLHDGSLCLRHAALAGADGGDQLIHDVGSLFQALQDMGALLGLFQVILGAAADDLVLELDVLLDHLLQGQDLGHLVVNGQHDDADGILQLGIADTAGSAPPGGWRPFAASMTIRIPLRLDSSCRSLKCPQCRLSFTRSAMFSIRRALLTM